MSRIKVRRISRTLFLCIDVQIAEQYVFSMVSIPIYYFSVTNNVPKIKFLRLCRGLEI